MKIAWVMTKRNINIYQETDRPIDQHLHYYSSDGAKKYLLVINLQFPWLSSFRLSSSETAKCREVKIKSDVDRDRET